MSGGGGLRYREGDRPRGLREGEVGRGEYEWVEGPWLSIVSAAARADEKSRGETGRCNEETFT